MKKKTSFKKFLLKKIFILQKFLIFVVTLVLKLLKYIIFLKKSTAKNFFLRKGRELKNEINLDLIKEALEFFIL